MQEHTVAAQPRRYSLKSLIKHSILFIHRAQLNPLALLNPLARLSPLLLLALPAASTTASIMSAIEARVSEQLYHTGGVFNEVELCPKSPYDTIAAIGALNPQVSEGQMPMTIEGMQAYIQKNNITTIEALLDALPNHYRTNFSLVEHTRATGQSNLEYPRIVLFGSDGRFMLNVGTKPDDPMYNVLDVAELHLDTGRWEFSVFDFRENKPLLTRNDPTCNACHGDKNSRPVWGDFQEWTGVFGDSVVDGPRPEALDHTHAIKMNEIMRGQGGSKRFDFLIWKPALMHRGGFREIAHHDFGPELLISNLAMGTANAQGAYIRLAQTEPEKYRALRKDLLLSYYSKRVSKIRYPVKINHSKQSLDYSRAMNTQIKNQLAPLALAEGLIDTQLLTLGLDTSEAFSLATLHETEAPQTGWSLAVADQYDLLMLQVLDDLRRDDPAINKILKDTALAYPIYGCPDTASSVADIIDFKLLHLFYLGGEARYQVNWIYFPKDLDDIYDQVFLPISQQLIAYLAKAKV